MTQSQGCGCRIEQETILYGREEMEPDDCKIVFCPMHSAAEEMRTLLQAVVDYSGVGEKFRDECKKLLAKASPKPA